LFVIAHRRIQDERRRNARMPLVADGVDPDAAVVARATATAADDTERTVLRRLATERVQAICAQLSPDQRDVVLLRIVGDLTVEQVGHVLGKSSDAVKQLQRRGFEAVRRIVAPEEITPEGVTL
jgi:RNA polymerase sigma-70 factor (ECF subfamily)